jgi:hypothetical protein
MVGFLDRGASNSAQETKQMGKKKRGQRTALGVRRKEANRRDSAADLKRQWRTA